MTQPARPAPPGWVAEAPVPAGADGGVSARLRAVAAAPVQPAEMACPPDHTGARSAFVALALFAMTAAFILTKTGRDALYLQGGGIHDLPFAYMAIAVVSVPTAFSMLALMRHAGPRRARLLAPLATAATIALWALFARPGAGAFMTAFFVFVPLAFSVLFSVTWLLVADLLAGAPRAALASAYGRAGAASILGGMAGGALAKLLAARVEPRALLWVGAASLLVAALVIAVAQARYPMRRRAPDTASGPAPTPEDVPASVVLGQGYARLLLAAGMLGSLVGVLVEFQLYLAAATAGGDARAQAGFFANIYVVVNAAALVVQLWLLPILQRVIGVHGALHVLPAALLGGAATVLASTSSAARALLRITEGGLKASIHRVSWEQAYLPLAEPQRAVAKVLVDGAGARVAEGLAALLLWVWLRLWVGDEPLVGHSTAWIGWLLLVATCAWVVLTRVLARGLQAATSAQAETRAPDWRLAVPLPDT
jgi:hypothetical protein